MSTAEQGGAGHAGGHRPRLDPDTAAIRHALHGFLREHSAPRAPTDHDREYILAVSGGADSMALAAAAAFLAQSPRRRAASGVPAPRFYAVTVDHGLQDGSDTVAARTVAALRDLGLSAGAVRVDVPPGAKTGVEAAARTARYAALEEIRADRGGTAVLTAHTRDDQAETVLLGLARGSGARSLAGIRPVGPGVVSDPGRAGRPGALWRPLLNITRAQTRAACAAAGIPVWDDPMNDDEAFARVRARRTVLPILERQLGPGVAAALARTARLLAADSDELEAQAVAAAAGLDIAYPRPPGRQRRTGRGGRMPAAASDVPAALRTRILRDWLGAAGARQEVTMDHIAAVDALLTKSAAGAVSTPPGALVTRVRRGEPEAGDLHLRYV